MQQVNLRSLLVTLAVLGSVCRCGIAATQILAVSGDPSPDGNGSFKWYPPFQPPDPDDPLFMPIIRPNAFDVPSLNNAGQVVFRGVLDVPGGAMGFDSGVFLGDGEILATVVRRGDLYPDGSGTISSVNSPVLNDAGHLLIPVGIESGGGIDRGMLLARDFGRVEVARTGQPVEGTNKSFWIFSNPNANQSNQFIFNSLLQDTDRPGSGQALYRVDETMLTQLVRSGDAPPDGDGHVGSIGEYSLNNHGQVAFQSHAGIPELHRVGTHNFLLDETGLRLIARHGHPVPDGNGFFTQLGRPVLNDAGQVAFTAILGGALPSNHGLFLASGSDLDVIARKGDPIPGGDGLFTGFGPPALNDDGLLVFNTGVDPGNQDPIEEAIFTLADGDLVELVRTGDLVDPDTAIASTGGFAVNNAGQVAFAAPLMDPTGSEDLGEAILVHDETRGLLEVARTGDAMLNSTIAELTFEPSTQDRGQVKSGFNEAAEVAYRFTLADGREGIALWSANPAADFNLDGVVDRDDLRVWQTGMGTIGGATLAMGDADADRDVDGHDLLALLIEMGQTRTSNSRTIDRAATIPEPQTIILALMTFMVLGSRRWRLRSAF